jgi:hypothetical protein
LVAMLLFRFGGWRWCCLSGAGMYPRTVTHRIASVGVGEWEWEWEWECGHGGGHRCWSEVSMLILSLDLECWRFRKN